MDASLPTVEFAFPGPLRDKLLAAIESGAKTATSSLVREYEVAGESMPTIGDRGVVVDSSGRPRFVIETTAVEVTRLGDVTLEHALAEGEAFTSVDEWRRAHMRFWTSDEMRAELGTPFEVSEDALVVMESFVIVGPPNDTHDPCNALG